MSNIENTKNLLTKNPRELIRLLEGVVDVNACGHIDDFLLEQVKMMLKLSKNHLNFAQSIKANLYWRQKVSRSYYACYTASRAIRLCTAGAYSTDSSDHKKIDSLPSDFSDKNYWSNFLSQFKADRNTADYDHISNTSELNNTPRESLSEAIRFCIAVSSYLTTRFTL